MNIETGKKNSSEPCAEKIESRRNIIKKAVTVGGMTVAVTQWSKPVVDSVVLPSHAQTSIALTAAITIP